MSTERAEFEIDIGVEDHGSIFLLRPRTARAIEWLRRAVGEESVWWAGALVVEHRYLTNIVAGAIEAGLEVV